MTAILIDGNVRVQWVTTLSSKTSPTATQLNAGVDITPWITPDGLDLSPDQNMVDVSTLADKSELQDFGKSKIDASLTMKRDSTDTGWTTFASQPIGYIVVRRAVATGTTFTAAQKVQVYHLKASSRFPIKPAANDMDKFTVKFGLQSEMTDESTVA